MRATHIPRHVAELSIFAPTGTRRDTVEFSIMHPDQWRRVFFNLAHPRREVWPSWYRWLYRNWERSI